MHRRRVFCVEERGEERAGDDRRREKAGVKPLLGFFTEVEASSDICAEELENTLLQNIKF